MAQHAFLIAAHDNQYVLERLLRLLDDERNDIYLHVDKKSRSLDIGELLRVCTRSRVVLVPRINVFWGDYSQVDAVLRMLALALRGEYAYYHLLSGADLPLASNDRIHDFFREHAGKEFVAFNDFPAYTHEWLAYVHVLNRCLRSRSAVVRWSCSRARRASIAVQRRLGVDRLRRFGSEVRYGSDWFSVTHPLASHLVSQRREIRRMFRFTMNPVEFYVQTVVWNSRFRSRVFDLEDPYRGNMRLIDFTRGVGSSPHVWRMSDLDQLLGSDRLFARKFDPDVDREVIDALSSARPIRPWA